MNYIIYYHYRSDCHIKLSVVSAVHGEANFSQTAQKREKNNVIIFLVPNRDMVKRDAVTKLHGIISMYINVTAIQS